MIGTVNLWDEATALAGAAAVITSAPISNSLSKGFCSLLVVLAGAGPSVDITMTVGKSDTDTFYTPYDGSGTNLGEITLASLAATRWLQFSPVIAPYFKVVITGAAGNGAGTTVKAYLMYQEEDL